MARLPIVTQQKQYSADLPGAIQSLDSGTGQAISKGAQQLGSQTIGISEQWQKAQNYAETMDAKNKAQEGYIGIIGEADEYNDYENPKQLEEQRQSYINQLVTFNKSIANGFTNSEAADDFGTENKTSSIVTKSKINSIFRAKTIEMGKSNLVKSQDTSRDNFISTGSDVFKQNYTQDLDGALDAGYINRIHYNEQIKNMETWNKDKALNDAAVDPLLAEQNLKDGKYGKMTAKENLDLHAQIQSINTKKTKVDEYNQVKQQDINEDEMLKFAQNKSISYDDKLREINKKEFMNEISPTFASSARRYLTGIYEGTGLAATKNELMADIVLTSETLQAMGDDKGKEKLDEVNKLRNRIIKAQADGKLTDKDADALNLKLSKDRTIIGEETEAVGSLAGEWSPFNYGYNNAYESFKIQFGSVQGSKMFKSYYYKVEGKNYDDKKKKELVNSMLINESTTQNQQIADVTRKANKQLTTSSGIRYRIK